MIPVYVPGSRYLLSVEPKFIYENNIGTGDFLRHCGILWRVVHIYADFWSDDMLLTLEKITSGGQLMSDIWFVYQDINDETQEPTGRVVLSVPVSKFGLGEVFNWTGQPYRVCGAIAGPLDRDWLLCEPYR